MGGGLTWRVVGASVAGAAHLARGAACDDAHHAVVLDDLVVVSVADGAGSASRGGEGAQVAARWCAELLALRLLEPTRPPWEQLAREVFSSARDQLRRRARSNGARLRDLATTIVMAAAAPDGVAAAQIGDGAAVVSTAEGMRCVPVPERSEFLNETVFLTSTTWDEHIRSATVAGCEVRGVALMTDGLQLLALDLASDAPFAPFFEPLYRFASTDEASEAELAAFLQSERVCERTDDDKTIVLAVPG